MLSVSKLARSCGLSRTAVLYYESIGLLQPACRTAAGYRLYGEAEARRLRAICTYRRAGLRIQDIRELLEERSKAGAAGVLRRRLDELAGEMEALREHQGAILQLLAAGRLGGKKPMTKQKWVSIMKDAGFSEADMHRWHVVFERTAPDDHEQFLRYLHIQPDEIAAIRQWSREGAETH